ncbi:MAG: 6-carboxytetrahydropterin synthase QueD [Candidatus Omnitrophota bacterium]|nr:6-carboxytetrahydropterin synthase QueD [Candidatus Omnitrophota bacterium]
MYEILVRGDFSSAHNLRGYKGKCEGLHGHSWKVDARFEKETLNGIGISVDFTILKARLRDILKELDHKHLNKISAFKTQNPSAENIARYIFEKLKGSSKEKGLLLKSVSVWESENSRATYYE